MADWFASSLEAEAGSGDGRTTPEWLRNAEQRLRDKPLPHASASSASSSNDDTPVDALPLETVRGAVRRLMLSAGEVIDGSSDEALELLVALEHILGHGFKRKSTLLAALSPERTLWSFISESLEKFCEPARKTTAFVRSADLEDSQRCGVWLRLCLNEGCLHKMLETLANDMPAQQLRAWYQDHAFVRSDHMTVLLSLCAGLDEVDFRLPLHLPPELPAELPAAPPRAERALAPRGSFDAAARLRLLRAGLSRRLRGATAHQPRLPRGSGPPVPRRFGAALRTREEHPRC